MTISCLLEDNKVHNMIQYQKKDLVSIIIYIMNSRRVHWHCVVRDYRYCMYQHAHGGYMFKEKSERT